jgi:hypothetical protein
MKNEEYSDAPMMAAAFRKDVSSGERANKGSDLA